MLDGRPVGLINPDLTVGADVTTRRSACRRTPASRSWATRRAAPFDITEAVAVGWLHGPIRTAGRIATCCGRGSTAWTSRGAPGHVDHRLSAGHARGPVASLYESAFEIVRQRSTRSGAQNRRAAYAERWWMHVEARPEMRRTLAPLRRYLGTPT